MASLWKLIAFTFAVQIVSCRSRTGDSSAQAASATAYEADFKSLYQYDFGAINEHSMKSNALPWKVIATAMLVYNESKTGAKPALAQIPGIMRRFGFIYPKSIGNLNDASIINDQLPMGIVRKNVNFGFVLPVDVVNVGCVACHGSAVYDKKGLVTEQAWIGLPSTSINLDGYVDFVYQSLKYVYASDDRIAKAYQLIKTEFQTGIAEQQTINWIINNTVKTRIAALKSSIDHSTPFSNGGPGFTNGVASLKLQLDVIGFDSFHQEEAGFTSIPDLTRRGMRTSILYDGFYSPYEGVKRFESRTREQVTNAELDKLGDLVSFFAIPTMGQSIEGAVAAAPDVRKVVRALHNGYRAPAFPGDVNDAKAERGRVVFDSRCSSCHGSYEGTLHDLDIKSYPNRFVAQGDIGTDPTRWQVISDKLLATLNKDPRFKNPSHPQRNPGYLAPMLSGLWATAPYLHNGSVPTLYQFLHPEQRAKKFYVGGHRLNYETMGIDGADNGKGIYDYPAGYEPWSQKVLYDTSAPGKHAEGHEGQLAGIAEEQKSDLLEFLKLL